MEFVQGRNYVSNKGVEGVCVGKRLDGSPILEVGGQLVTPNVERWLCVSLPEGWRMLNIPFKDSPQTHRMVGYVIPNDQCLLHWSVRDIEAKLKAGHNFD